MDVPSFENELTLDRARRAGDEAAVHDAYEAAVADARAALGGTHPLRIGGDLLERDERFLVRSPGDLEVRIGEFAAGDDHAVDRAVDTAREAFADWRHASSAERAGIFRDAADLLRERKFRLAAVISLENGKDRAEALADVDEAIDFLSFYARDLDRVDDFVRDTGEPTPGERCENVRRPYGVIAVVAPFNFPLAILAGMTTGAAIVGNTTVVKPASATPLIAHEFLDVLEAAGLPDGVVNLVTGSGRAVGSPLVEHEDVSGVAFTGSRAVGRELQREFAERSGPVVAELGGKNPVVVTETADLEAAAAGVAMGAFSFAGQKCSATARVYVAASRFDAFAKRLVAETESLPVREPTARGAVVSPLIDDTALDRYRRIVAEARNVGRVLTGGHVLETGLPDGRYVAPTVVTDVPHDHPLAREEHFAPFVTLHPVADLAEGIARSNDSRYGLCAGLFSTDDAEIARWLDEVESGMCYVNRAKSATTGALVGAQPFGGWKASGTTGTFAGGYDYLRQFTREQSRTVVGREFPPEKR
jgi:1-pyrroline-5-carboxylate dehydrogenase